MRSIPTKHVNALMTVVCLSTWSDLRRNIIYSKSRIFLSSRRVRIFAIALFPCEPLNSVSVLRRSFSAVRSWDREHLAHLVA